MNPAYLINDVSTNLEQPPKFRILDVPDLSEEFKTIIKEGYPNLKPLALPGWPLKYPFPKLPKPDSYSSHQRQTSRQNFFLVGRFML